ncbi:MAG: DNA polymerase III subunit delta [Opitutales bacterium]
MPAYLAIVAGKDEFLVDRDARAFFEAARKRAGEGADAEVVDGAMVRVEDARGIETRFVESLRTMSMFGATRVLWLRNLNWVADTPQGRSEEVKERLASLLSAVTSAPDDVHVVISATPYDGRRKDLAAIKEAADEFGVHAAGRPPPYGADPQAQKQAEMAAAHLRALGVKFERGVPEAVVGRVGQSTRLVIGECDKLATYAGPGGTLRESDVHLLVPAFGEGDFFEPIEAFAARDLAWAQGALDRYFFHQSSGRPLLFALQGRLRLLIQIRALGDAGDLRLSSSGLPKGAFEAAAARHGPTFGGPAKSSANLFSQNPWYVSTKVAPAAALYTLAELVDAQLACGECFDALNRAGDEEQAVRSAFLRALAVKRQS